MFVFFFFTSFYVLAFMIFDSTFINVYLRFYCTHCILVQSVYIYIYIYMCVCVCVCVVYVCVWCVCVWCVCLWCVCGVCVMCVCVCVWCFFNIHLFSLYAPLPWSNTTCIVYRLLVFFPILYTFNILICIYFSGVVCVCLCVGVCVRACRCV